MAENEGWAFPSNADKCHYFVEGRSLCGRWMFLGHIGPGAPRYSAGDQDQKTSDTPRGNDCKGCHTKALKRQQKEVRS